MEVKYGTAQFEAEDGSIKVWIQRRYGEYYVRWNDGEEIHMTENYMKGITANELFYLSQLVVMIDELDNPTIEEDKPE